MRPGPTDETIKRIEMIEGIPIREALVKLYIDGFFTYRKLCKRWNINVRTLMRLFRFYKIEPRKGSEAVKTQWIKNLERRKKASEFMKKFAKELAKKGKHGRLGKTKENSESIRQMAIKLSEISSASRQEVREKMSVARKFLHTIKPERHIQSKFSPTNYKLIIIEHLRNLGYDILINYNIPPYWINIIIPKLKLGIYCVANGRFPLSWDRHIHITDRGIRLIYITNSFIGRGNFSDIDNYIRELEIFGSYPPSKCKETVVWGRRNGTIFRGNLNQVTIEFVSMNKINKAIIKTTS